MPDTTLNLGLLLCDDIDAEHREQFGAYTPMFERGLARADANIRLRAFDCTRGELPNAPEDCDGYIISGSRCGVYEAHAWIAPLMDFVRACRARQIKVVGICFGHQLLAQAFGGKVEKAARGWGFGIQTSCITERAAWMHEPDDYNLVVIHQDQVVAMPPGFRTLAQNDFCPHGMISDENFVLGIQGHPEFSPAFCAFKAEQYRERMTPETFDAALHSLENLAPDSDLVFAWICAFLRAPAPA